MKGISDHNLISRTERSNLLVMAGLLTLINIANFFVAVAEQVSRPEGIYILERHGLMPFANMASAFLILFVIFARNYLLATIWSSLCSLAVIYEMNHFVKAFRANIEIPDLFQVVLTSISFLEIAWSLVLLALWVWLLGIALRPHVFRNNLSN